jgi:predicted acetyltransferase
MPMLDSPKLDYVPSYVDSLREGYYVGIQKRKTEKEISDIEKNPQSFLDDFLAIRTDPVVLPNGDLAERMPQTKFWYVEEKHFIGEIGIRHRLTETLKLLGGHIGFGVRPSEQNKGRATHMLQLALGFCREQLGFDKVLITVNDINHPSIKVIEKCGGVLEDIIKRPYDEALARRYWITL